MATNSKFIADIGLKTDNDLDIGGNTTIDGNATVSGNLTVNGTTTTINATTTSVEDNMLELANQNTSSDTLDIGIYGNYDDGLSDGGATEYTGLFRDASDSTWKLFDGLETAPTTTVDTSDAGYTLADLQVGDLTATTLTATNGLTGSSITYPTSDGTNGQVIKTDGSGTLSFGDIPAGYTDSDVESYLSSGIDELRINENGTGFRMTNVGAFDNDGSGNFRIFSTDDLILSTNGDSGTAVTFDATTKDATFEGNITLSGTGSIKVPSGTTAQRDGTPANGMFRYNSEDAQFEGYADGAWGAIAGGGAGSAMETNNFTGDGSTTAFTLSSSVSDEDNLLAFIEGVYQNKTDFVASGTTITFDTAPVNGRNIVVHHVKSSISGSNVILNSFTGDGSDTTFTLSTAPQSENNTQVYLDGVYQNKTTYSVSETTLTFDAAPANGVEIEVMMFTQTTINEPAANTVGVTELNLSDGTNGQVLTTDGSGTLSFSTVSGTTINNNADNRIITGSGTANTLNGDSNFTYNGTTFALGGTSSNKSVAVESATGNKGFLAAWQDTAMFGINRDPATGTMTQTGRASALVKLESYNADAYITFQTSTTNNAEPTERMRILSGGGITFNGDTATANALDDYEEGTWTAGFSESTDTHTGYYTKVGNLVHVAVYGNGVTVNASGVATITGLPFTVRNSFAAVSLTYNTYSNNAGGAGYFRLNNTEVQLINENNTTQATVNVGSSRKIMMAGTYQTDT